MPSRLQPAWSLIGASVRGAAHVRANLPNQDAINIWPPAHSDGLPGIVVVSDGHGSAKCFRSDKGARRAVRVANTLIQQFLDSQSDLANLSGIKRTAEERLPQLIARKWQDLTVRDWHNNPFSPDELETLEKKAGTAARQAVEAQPVLAYGATLLGVVVTETFILYLQLGDGDILTVSETGQVERPVPKDERLLGNETTSLSGEQAWRDFQVCFQVMADTPPALILLSTDGYANSFRDEASFSKVGSDLLELLRSDGVDKVNASLKMWLAEASQIGSGDDITLGLMCRMDALSR
jgi:serine/threonine protein phosphatase PrpC